MIIDSMPEATASSTTYWISGLSTSGSISFGDALVAGRKRVPRPAAGKTALRTCCGIIVAVSHTIVRRITTNAYFVDASQPATDSRQMGRFNRVGDFCGRGLLIGPNQTDLNESWRNKNSACLQRQSGPGRPGQDRQCHAGRRDVAPL